MVDTAIRRLERDISCCDHCPYFKRHGIREGYGLLKDSVCTNTKGGKRITNAIHRTKIPVWCPLPTAPQKTK